MPRKILSLAIGILFLAAGALAEGMTQRDGWVVMPTQKTYPALIDAVKGAAGANGMAIVTEAGPTGAAASRGITIPGNRVIGVFNNDFAVKILALSTAAMIEAPIRIYVTENPDGMAILSYKTPSFVLAPYMAEGGPELAELAADLDARFAAIAAQASQ
jgi:uncharacterized protein (DUF302 family)